MVFRGFWLVSMVFQVCFMVFHGFWLVSMDFQGFQLDFHCINSPRLVKSELSAAGAK